MDNNEKDIFVGREYENAFNSIILHLITPLLI